jgi:PAS domain S-box-containing protein
MKDIKKTIFNTYKRHSPTNVNTDNQPLNSEKLLNLSSESKDHLIEELNLHQIELEMQNEQLRETQLELVSSRNKYSDLYDFAPVAYLTVNEKGVILEANLTCATFFGFERQLLIGKNIYEFIANDNKDLYYLCNKNLLKNMSTMTFELKLKKKDKAEFNSQLDCIVVPSADDNFSQIRIAITDITKLKQAETALQKVNENLETMVEQRTSDLKLFKAISDNANYGMYISDLDGNIEYINAYFAFIHGYEPVELIGKNISIFYNKEQLKEVKIINDKIIEQGGYNAKELWHTHQNGNTFPMLMNCFVFKDENKTPLLLSCTAVDISEIKLMQTQLIRSDRLASTGQLAAFIAHEINSPLQSIIFLISSLKKKYREDSENIDLLYESFQNIRNTVKSLIHLNFPCHEEKQLVDINTIIEQTIILVKGYLKKSKVKVILNLSSNLPQIKVSSQQISQVLINLVNNSVEAITGTSEPKAGFERILAKQGKITISTSTWAKNINIQFADTGPGFTENVKKQIFEPFYTGKKKFGSGIGLSICKDIIKNHGGSITADNLSDHGAVFAITLPAG